MILDQIKDCPHCGEIDEVEFPLPPGIDDPDEVIDVPKVSVLCGYCDREYVATYTGWTAHEDAG